MSNEKSAKTTMGYFWAAREMLTPTLKKTAFLEKGVLTPEEFVRAGDELVYRCPTWSWEHPTNPNKIKSYLPPDKQFLITRNVPCRDRVATLEQTLDVSSCVADNDGEDEDWMVSSLPTKQKQPTTSIEDEFDVLDEDGEVVDKKPRPEDIRVEQQQSDHRPNKDENDDEYADMADFEDENVIMDHDVAAAAVNEHDCDDDDGHIVKVRTYDLSITYDKYYQTPRIWLSGKSIHGDPLTAEETMEDVMTDYAHKTVTMEAHPFLSGPHASIHPCQHGKVMKTIVRNLMAAADDVENVDKPNGPSVEMYLFIFLKFVSSIIPTINYDFTMDVTADTTKK
jgi:ubiquitin-like-conjugating enzyme ATG3